MSQKGLCVFVNIFLFNGMSSSKWVLELFSHFKGEAVACQLTTKLLAIQPLTWHHIGEKGSACVITIIEN